MEEGVVVLNATIDSTNDLFCRAVLMFRSHALDADENLEGSLGPGVSGGRPVWTVPDAVMRAADPANAEVGFHGTILLRLLVSAQAERVRILKG